MTTPEPNNADRIIAAQREEARNTRRLLLVIFVGLPAIGGLFWLIVLLIATASGSSAPAAGPIDNEIVSTSDDDQGDPTTPSPFSEPPETTEPSIGLSDLQADIGKPWSALPQYVLDQTVQKDPWGNIITELPSIVPDKWVVSSVNTDTNLTLVMKPIGDASAAGDPYVHTVTYSASGHGTGNISYTVSSSADPAIVDHRLPWAMETTVESSNISLIVLNEDFDLSSIVSCSITVDGKLVAQSTSSESSSGVASCTYSGPGAS